MDDDIAPALVNGAHLGALHGFDGYVMDVFQHGKTNSDIGSIWSNEGIEYVLLRILSVNQLFFVRRYSDIAPPVGQYTHISGAANTNSFTASQSVKQTFYPMNINRNIKVFVDGLELNSSEGIWTYNRNVRFEESYGVLSREDYINWYIQNGNTGATNVSGSPIFSVKNVYEFDMEGNLTIYYEFEVLRNINFSFLYGLQAQLAGATHFYVPKASPFTQDGNTKNYSLIEPSTTTTTDVIFTTNVASPNSGTLFDRFFSMNSNNVFAMGFLPILDAEPNIRRNSQILAGAAAMSIAPFGKAYMRIVNKGTYAPPIGQKFSFVGYRNIMSRNSDRTSFHTVRSSYGNYIYIDWHNKNFTDQINIPEDLIGKNYTVFEKTSNVTLSNGTLSSHLSIPVSSSGSYAYAVIKIDN